MKLQVWYHEIIKLTTNIHTSCVPQIYTVIKQLSAASSAMCESSSKIDVKFYYGSILHTFRDLQFLCERENCVNQRSVVGLQQTYLRANSVSL